MRYGGRDSGDRSAFVDAIREWSPGGVRALLEVSLPTRRSLNELCLLDNC